MEKLAWNVNSDLQEFPGLVTRAVVTRCTPDESDRSEAAGR
jgi:hypothetical protein